MTENSVIPAQTPFVFFLNFFYFAKKLRPDPLKQIQNFACWNRISSPGSSRQPEHATELTLVLLTVKFTPWRILARWDKKHKVAKTLQWSQSYHLTNSVTLTILLTCSVVEPNYILPQVVLLSAKDVEIQFLDKLPLILLQSLLAKWKKNIHNFYAF